MSFKNVIFGRYKMIEKPLRIHAKSLSDALAPSKKIACGADIQRLCEASAFIAGVPIVCKIFARKPAFDVARAHVCGVSGSALSLCFAYPASPQWPSLDHTHKVLGDSLSFLILPQYAKCSHLYNKRMQPMTRFWISSSGPPRVRLSMGVTGN